MGGVVRAVKTVVTTPFRAAGRVFDGVGKIFKGDIGGGLKDIFIKSGGELVKGALDTGKHLLGDPIVAGIAGAVLMPGMPFIGAALGVGVGQLGSKALGGLSDMVAGATGIGPQEQCQQAHNHQCFGPRNGCVGAGGGGIMPPCMPPHQYPYPPMMPQYPMMPPYGQQPPYGQMPGYGQMPPYGQMPGYGNPGMNPQMQMMMMGQMMGMMSNMMMMMSMMGQMGNNPFMGGGFPGGQPPFYGCAPGCGPRFC